MDESDVVTEADLDLSQLRKWFVLRSGVLGGECVLVVCDPKYLDEARGAFPDRVVYFPSELRELLLRKASPMFVQRIHMIKRVLDGVNMPRRP